MEPQSKRTHVAKVPSYSRDPLPQNAKSKIRTPLGNLREIHTDANEHLDCVNTTFNAKLGRSGVMCECNLSRLSP